MKQKIDLSTLSAAELQQALAEKQKAEKAAEMKARKSFEQEKNDFCNTSAAKFKQMRSELAELKAFVITEANKLYERMYELNGKEAKDVKTFTLKNADDTVKVVVDRQERLEFTDEATVHINTVKDIFREKFAQRNQGLYNLLDGLLVRNSKQDYDPRLLSRARRQIRELGHEALTEAFDKLYDCQIVVGTSLYCRAYMRNEQGKYSDIVLQFSAL